MPTAAPANDVEICRPVNEKKRKGSSAAANDDGGTPSKKKCKKRFCKAEGCTKQVVKGGVCVSHGATTTRKRCSTDGCTNFAVKGGVCKRHGAKVKLCNFEGCTNKARNGKVCIRHGAKGKPPCSSEGCSNQAFIGGLCVRHGAKVKPCSSKGCKNQVQKGGVCKRHGANSLLKHRPEVQVTRQRSSRQQGGGNQNKVSKGVKISDNEEEMEQKLSPIVGTYRYADEPRRRSGRLRRGAFRSPQANVQGGDDQSESTVKVMDTSEEEGEWELKDQVSTSKVAARRSIRLLKGEKVNYNVDDAFDAQIGNVNQMEEDEAEVANPQHDELDTTTPKGTRMRGKRNLDDNREEDASDVVSTQEGEGGLSEAMDDGDGESRGSDGQHDVDLGGEGGVHSEEVNLPQMGSGFDGIDDEEKKNTTNPSSQDKEQAQMDQGKSGADDSTEKDAAKESSTQSKTNDGLRDVLSKQHRGQNSNKGSKTLRNSSSDDDDVVSGVEQNDTLKQHTVEIETENHDSLDEANQEDYREETDKQGTEAIKLCAELNKAKTKKAIIESHLQLKTAEWQEMTSKASDVENECDFRGEDGGDVQVEDADDAKLEETTKKFEAEKADLNSQVHASSKELNELKNQVEMNAAQNEAVMRKMIDDFAAERSGFELRKNEQQSTIESLRDELKGQKIGLKKKDETIADLKRKEQISVNELKEASTRLGEANSRNVLLTKQLEDMKHELRHKEDTMAKKEEERKRLQSSIDAAKRAHAAQIQERSSQLKTKSDAIDSLNSDLTEIMASKAEIESELEMKTAALQEMTAKASDAEKRVKSVEEKLAQALKEKRSEISQLSAKIKDMKGQHENTLKRNEAERNRLEKKLECLQSQMESRKKSTPNTKSCLEGNTTGEPVRKTIEANLRKEIEVLMNTNDIPDVSLDDIIGQKDAKDALSELKPFRDPEYECLYADDEDDSNRNTGVLLYGPPGTGKTMFAKALATNGDCIFIKISPDDILRQYIGQSEERMRAVFLVAKEKAAVSGKTAVLFIDECDRLFRKPRDNDCEVTSNITGIFQECMNGIDEPKGQLIVLGATNYMDELPKPIKSRFAPTIKLNLPDRNERIAILKFNMKSSHSLTEDDFARFADMTDGYSGRDIFNLITNGAEPARKKEAREHCGAWCKNEKDQYIPCDHSLDHPCRDKETGTLIAVKKRTKTVQFRARPLAMKHIEIGIGLIGACKIAEHEEA